MVNGIDHRLFDGGIRIIPETIGFGSVVVFDDCLLKIVGLDMAQRVTSDTGKRTCKGLLVKTIPTCPFRKPDHINLCRREELLWMIAKKEQADVFWQSRFIGTTYHIHLPSQIFG